MSIEIGSLMLAGRSICRTSSREGKLTAFCLDEPRRHDSARLSFIYRERWLLLLLLFLVHRVSSLWAFKEQMYSS